MELKHSFTVPAGMEPTWGAFNDIEGVATCFPGATVTEVRDDDFNGLVKIKLGPISMQYTGTAEFVERNREAGVIVLSAKGKDKRGQGTAEALVTARLAEAEGGTTRIDVDTDLNITGKPAQFGRGMIQDVSEKLLGQFVDNLSARLAAENPQSAGVDQRLATPTGDERRALPANDPVAFDPSALGNPRTSTARESNELNALAFVPIVLKGAVKGIGRLLWNIAMFKWLRRRN